jgi:hypothetical protein
MASSIYMLCSSTIGTLGTVGLPALFEVGFGGKVVIKVYCPEAVGWGCLTSCFDPLRD